ncbi:MAG TPA: cell division protein FtsZ [Polyangia bacterium]
MLEFDNEAENHKGPVIKVVGVGGGGGNAINTMIDAGIDGVDFIVANTDCQVLETSQASIKIHLGKHLTKGLGAGANPEIGKAAALEDASRIAEALAGADMVFVTAGMGGGTGTGAAPIIAQVARELGALTVGVVTKPFAFEGSQRKKKATGGIAELGKAVDALIVIPNDRLVTLAGIKMTLKDAFAMVDNVLLNAVRGISDLVMVPGLINVDFADVRTIMTGMGRALMGTGQGKGEKRALEAAQQAISSPLLEDVSINGATGILINITGGPDLTLSEVTEAATLIEEAADPGANIIFGSVIDAHAGDSVRITVIATGFQPGQDSMSIPMPISSKGSLPRRTASDQMALPMGAVPPPMGAQPQPQMGLPPHMAMPVQTYAPAGTGRPVWPNAIPSPLGPGGTAPWPPAPDQPSYYEEARAQAPEMGSEPMEIIEDLDGEFADSLAAPMRTPGVPAGSEWGAGPTTGERPIIRPAVPGNAALRGRQSGSMSRVGGDQFGDEESELDRPTFIRRGILPPG